jgi:hypothetical protein
VDKIRKRIKKRLPNQCSEVLKNQVKTLILRDYLDASSTATATATVAPTMGLLPIPISPIISS